MSLPCLDKYSRPPPWTCGLWEHTSFTVALITGRVTAVRLPACQLRQVHTSWLPYASSPWDYNTGATADVHKWTLYRGQFHLHLRGSSWNRGWGCSDMRFFRWTLVAALSNLIKNSSWQWRQKAAETAPWKAGLNASHPPPTHQPILGHWPTHKTQSNPFCPMPVSAVCVLTLLKGHFPRCLHQPRGSL